MGAVLPFKSKTHARLRWTSKTAANLAHVDPLGALLQDLTLFANNAKLMFVLDPERKWIAVYRDGRFSGAWAWIRAHYWWVTPSAAETVWHCKYSWEAAALMSMPCIFEEAVD